jgi:hypothetical protein
MVDEDKSPADRILDLIVFGPAGLALTAADEFPTLVDKGRRHLEGQVRTARLVGQVAFQMGRRQVDQLLGQLGSKVTPTATPAPARPEPTAPAASPGPAPTTPVPGPTSNGHAKGAPDTLAIPGYDSLSASQVVQRLAGLSHDELIDVRAHEQSQRHRRTILNRVEQLLAGADAE